MTQPWLLRMLCATTILAHQTWPLLKVDGTYPIVKLGR